MKTSTAISLFTSVLLLLAAPVALAQETVTFQFSGTQFSSIYPNTPACSNANNAACVPTNSTQAYSFSFTTPWNENFSDASAPNTDVNAWRFYDHVVVQNGVLTTFQGAAGNCGDYQAELNGCYQSSYFMVGSNWIQYHHGVNAPADTGGTRVSLVGTVVTLVPEPSMPALFLLGLAVVMAGVRRFSMTSEAAAGTRAL
jgi:hypothetical protein